MKRILLFVIFAISITTVHAQQGQRAERIEALKVAYITQVLKLTAEEAQKFWPTYNSYFEELKKVRQANKEDELKFQEEALAVKKKFRPEFKKILNDDARVNLVFKAEGEFRAELKKELQKRMEQRKQQRPKQ